MTFPSSLMSKKKMEGMQLDGGENTELSYTAYGTLKRDEYGII